MNTDTIAGSFLVSTPLIGGGPFWQAVVLILEHDETGAVGLILNEPTIATVVDHLPQVAEQASAPASVFLGGPVQTDTAIVLARSHTAEFLRPACLGDIGMVDPDDLPQDALDVRVFAGYSGWDPGQLEDELDEGAWWVLPVDREAIFSEDIEDLWERSVASAPGTIPFHRTYPHDRTLN